MPWHMEYYSGRFDLLLSSGVPLLEGDDDVIQVESGFLSPLGRCLLLVDAFQLDLLSLFDVNFYKILQPSRMYHVHGAVSVNLRPMWYFVTVI